MAERFAEAGKKFAELVEVMARLRAPGGCPWDRKQTFESIKPYLLEEAYEVMDAIDQHDWRGLEEELGDLLLQPVFFAEMAAEKGLFSVADSLDAINQKLVRRHPHIFGDAKADTPEEVLTRWNEIKKQEKAEQGVPAMASVLDSVPKNLPALMEADKVSKKAAGLGFDLSLIHIFSPATVFKWSNGKVEPFPSLEAQKDFQGTFGMTIDKQNRIWFIEPALSLIHI